MTDSAAASTSGRGLTVDDLVVDLRRARTVPGDILTVHSSLRSIGHVDGGAAAVVEALVRAVAPGGTVMFPGLTFSGSVTVFLREHRVIDLREHPSRNGAIPRAAGERPDAVRSLHPTHTVIAIGPAAPGWFAGDQNGEGPCGENSPFARAARAGGKIILIGVTNSCNTTLHCVEEAAAPYIFCGEEFDATAIDAAGRERTVTVKGYTTGQPRDFAAIEPRLLESGIMTMHTLGQAELRVIDGRRLLLEVTEWVRREPYLLARTQTQGESLPRT